MQHAPKQAGARAAGVYNVTKGMTAVKTREAAKVAFPGIELQPEQVAVEDPGNQGGYCQCCIA